MNTGLRCSASVLALVAGIMAAAPAGADVTISSAATQDMSCSGGVCAPTARKAVLNVGDLENLLAAGSVDVTTTGSGVQAKDILIKASLTWSSGSTLTLDAHESVSVDSAVTVAGLAGLAIVTDDGGKNGTFSVGGKGNVTFANLSSSLSIDGTNYVLVGDIKTLASDIAGNPAGAFALANPYDASNDGTYTSCPVATEFTGEFEGLGNAISNLSIDGPSEIGEDYFEGLFAFVDSGAMVSDVSLQNVSVATTQRYVWEGAIAGRVGGTMASSYASGAVTVPKDSWGGGLVGDNGGTIENSHSAVELAGTKQSYAGGGLAGFNSGYIESSYATGAVSASWSGGLVERNDGQVQNSFATGSVSGVVAGGLVGVNGGSVESSYATGKVRVVRYRYGSFGGGLVGDNEGSIDNSYSTGAVVGMRNSDRNSDVGGLVGLNYSAISFSYSTGAVSSGKDSLIGGLIGDDQSEAGSLDDTYWDLDTSGIDNTAQGAGNISDDPGITGLTTEQFQSGLPAGFDPSIWNEESDIDDGFPYLLANPPRK